MRIRLGGPADRGRHCGRDVIFSSFRSSTPIQQGEHSLVSLQVALSKPARYGMELMPVVDESLSSAVNGEAVENGDSKVGELRTGHEKSEGAVEEPKPEKKGFLARAAQWKWKNIFTVAVLWLGYFFVNTAYSTIELFFPNEVGEKVDSMSQ